jgi:hypothetical protein
MSDTQTLHEIQARYEIAERVARAATPHLPAVPHRHRLAARLRRFADRIDT